MLEDQMESTRAFLHQCLGVFHLGVILLDALRTFSPVNVNNADITDLAANNPPVAFWIRFVPFHHLLFGDAVALKFLPLETDLKWLSLFVLGSRDHDRALAVVFNRENVPSTIHIGDQCVKY